MHRFSLRNSLLLATIVLAAPFAYERLTGADALHAAPLESQPEIFAVASTRATPSGATFKVPAGWSMTARSSVVVLEPPEKDSHVVIVDVPQAKDADSSVAAAWSDYRAESKRTVRFSLPQAVRDGWAERQYYRYETSPNERTTVFAEARRSETQWTVIIVDATDATFEKRASLVSLTFNSLRPKGYQRESFAGKKANPIDATRVEAMKEFVTRGIELLDIPGVGFSLIDAGNVVFEGGKGVKEIGKPEKVNANTLFMAASNTKAMTTLLLALLVDEGKLRWDQPVTEAYPNFRLGDEGTTRQVLVKHLISASTGLPRQDLEWLFEYANATPDSTMKLLATMQPTSPFGEVFQYSNIMAAAAGNVAAAIAFPNRELGAAYDEAMSNRIFEPLGMTRTTFNFATALNGNVAQPHGEAVNMKQVRARMDLNTSVIPMRPAGGMWTSAHDLSKYVQMELARGRLPGGKRLISEENLLARRTPQILVGEDVTHGMGLFTDKHWGVEIIDHGGSLFGYHSNMIWLPEHGVGAVILTNSESGAFLLAPFLRKLVEIVFDGRPEADEQLRVAAEQRKELFAKERERLEIPANPTEVGKLAAHYISKSLGELRVINDRSTVIFDTGEWKSTVASRKNDDGTISFITIDPAFSFEFVAAEKEGHRALTVRDHQHEYFFLETQPTTEKSDR